MSDDPLDTGGHRRAGQIAFALGFVVLAVGLVALLGDQTAWKAKVKLFAQPRFWPAVGVIGMAVFLVGVASMKFERGLPVMQGN